MSLVLRNEFKYPLRYFLMGMSLLAVVFATPHAGHLEGDSFLTAAQTAVWLQLGEWSAAWGSLKIILLGSCGILLVVALEEFLVALQREIDFKWLFALLLVPGLSALAGMYYLTKSLF
jgi:ABC-type uncharacterized transport system YnjBCD permease subunit